MRYLVFGILFLCLSGWGTAQDYVPVDKRSNIKFTIKNFAVNVNGRFQGLAGTIHFTEKDLPGSFCKVKVDANTVNTGINARDNHLRKPDYFDVRQFPVISFDSDKITESGKPGQYLLNGKLTIKGHSREISIPFTVQKEQDGLVFTGRVEINRRDFSVGGSSLILSDNLVVSLEVFAIPVTH
jgi:polyisoprenoid-binding protein YceI